MSAIAIRCVTKRFGDVTAVKDLALDVPEGSIYGFIGPNASGKSTTLRMIMNISPSRGSPGCTPAFKTQPTRAAGL